MLKKVPLLLFCLVSMVPFTFAQKTDSTGSNTSLSGAVSLTNNGISLVPTFSLGKPAAIFDALIAKNKFSFDPELTFSLEGKPWYFLFWFRYKLLTTDKFRVNVGTHLGLNFKNIIIPLNKDSNEMTITERYVAAEFSPNYLVTKSITVGIYYLYSHGIDPTTVNNTHFVTVNASFSNIRLISDFFMNIAPQFYYLDQGEHHGFYFTSVFTLTNRELPLSISSVINKAIHTEIISKKDFVWNVILTYAFGRRL